jgi:AcrR family transcriptional regulator
MSTASASTVPANRFERRKQRTREELAAAATRVLAEKGLEAKIADIARAADVGVGTFYLYFETKEALYDALVEDGVARLQATVDAAREGIDDPVGQTRAATAALCRFATENREIFKIVFSPTAAPREVVRRVQAHFAADIEGNIRAGIERGVFGAVAPVIAAQALVGMSTQLLAWWSEHEAVPVDWLEETIITLTLRGLGPDDTREGDPHHVR